MKISKPKGILVIELPEVPEDCYHCNQTDGTAGYCEHVGKFVDHFVKPGERYPTCPIREMPEAMPGDMILDTHVGSGSSLIACEEMGYAWVGFEIDSDYCGAAQNRIDQYRQQIRMPIEQLSLI